MQHILSALQIQQKINRIAHEIIENSSEFDTVYLAGISGNGWKLTQQLAEKIAAAGKTGVRSFEITLDKDDPLTQPIKADVDLLELKKGFVVLVDDVINSGKTMQYALTKLLEADIRVIKTVALVDRMHRRYPIKCDFVGLTLSTTLQERVEVEEKNGEMVAYLV